MSVEKLINDWQKGVFKPIYLLQGEEAFFIDEGMNYAEHKILTQEETSFNLTVFYGKDADWAEVVNACRRYPMFGNKQVVLIKEAQQMKDLDKLEGYLQNPMPSTILVIGRKEGTVDGRKKFGKLISTNGEVLTIKKMWENEVPKWLLGMVEKKGYAIESKALQLLVDHVGNDLSRLNNEVEKTIINLKERKKITVDDIETFVGVSKEYNTSELQHALIVRNLSKCLQIVQYFASDPKNNSIHFILPTLYAFFSKAYLIFGANNTNDEMELGKLLGYSTFSPYFKDLVSCAKNYRQKGVEQALLLLHEYNLKSIGIGSSGVSGSSLLKEMIVKLTG